MSDFATLQEACRVRAPHTALVLGSGLGDLSHRLTETVSVPFGSIPGLPASSIPGHKGRLTLGNWDGRPILLCEGRLHYYEGHPWEVVTRPLELCADLGVENALLTNAAGGIRSDLRPGSFMLLKDHITWLDRQPWKQPGPCGEGGERPSPYDGKLRQILQQAARQVVIELPEGIYAAVTGPCYETPAEIRALQKCGADAVGMSTAREVEAAQRRGLRCAAISCITNHAAGLSETPLHHEEVLATARAQAQNLERILSAALGLLEQGRKRNPRPGPNV